MISQKTTSQIAQAYGFKYKSMFLKLLEDRHIRLPTSKLFNQDTQVDLYARLGIPKGLESKEKVALLPLVAAYCAKYDLPTGTGFLLPKTREELAKNYGYSCTRTFTRHLPKKNINLPAYKLLDHEAQIYLYARMGIPKGLEEDEIKIATSDVKKYCKEQDLPYPILL